MAARSPAVRELVAASLDCLWRHRLRTALNVIGVTIGVAAVVAMMSVGEGARREALRQLGQLGLQNLFVEPRSLPRDTGRAGHSDGLTVADARRLQELIPPIERAAPVVERYAEVSTSGEPRPARVIGVTAAYQEVRDLQAAAGRLLEHDEHGAALVCVLGEGLARTLFQGQDAVGQAVRIGGTWFRVVGILKPARSGVRSGNQTGSDHDDTVLVPLGALVGQAGLRPAQPVTHIWLRARDAASPENIKPVVEQLLMRFHGGVADFAVMVPSELVEQRLRTQRTFNIVVGSIAVLALLVGGIGIMNTMLAAVLERTPEIGLRRTVGASRRWIVLHFLAESVAMTGVGGLAGVLTGSILAMAIAKLAQWPTHVSFTAIALALVVSSATGIGFGLYPASRAAKLEPIDAVRHE